MGILIRKRIRLIVFILCLAYILYFLGSMLFAAINFFGRHVGVKPDFSYVSKTYSPTIEDSICFSSLIGSDMNVLYTSEFKTFGYLSVYNYKRDYILLVRKLESKKTNLLKSYKPMYDKNGVDNSVFYDNEEMMPFWYNIDIERQTKRSNKNIIIDGEDITILKHNKDTLLFHGKIYDCSIGRIGNIREGLHMNDETFFRNPIDVEWLIFNRNNELFQYVIFSPKEKQVPVGITLSL